MLEKEIESLKIDIDRSKKECQSTEEKLSETLEYWQKRVNFYL